MRDLGRFPTKSQNVSWAAEALRHLVVLLRRWRGRGRELDGVNDEEDRHVVADEVVVPFLGVELRRKPRTSRTVSADPGTDDGRESHETGVFFSGSWRNAAFVYSVIGS